MKIINRVLTASLLPMSLTLKHNTKVLLKISFISLKDSNSDKPLDPCWVTGSTDGEGNFTIQTTVSKTTKIGFTFRAPL